MRIKKFIASNLQEGKLKIMKELGEDAVILSSRTIKKPTNPNEEIVEIVAAIDDTPMKNIRDSHKISKSDKLTGPPKASKYEEESESNKFSRTAGHIYDEIGSLKEVLGLLSDYVRYKYSGSLGDVYGKLYKELIKADCSEEFALSIVGKLTSSGKLINSFKEAIESARPILTEHIRIAPLLKKETKNQIILFAGTSGGGKTTVLVKQAIIAKLIMEANSLIVSADTQKVGGFEQLQTYASIAGIPFEVVYSSDELRDSILQKQDKDFIFVDTTGKSQNDIDNLSELQDLVNHIKPDIIYLVVSATTSYSTFNQILEKYDKINPSALILTKLDESASIGQILTVLKTKNLPVAYVTSGQKIPEDMEPATKELLGKLILTDNIEQINDSL